MKIRSNNSAKLHEKLKILTLRKYVHPFHAHVGISQEKMKQREFFAFIFLSRAAISERKVGNFILYAKFYL